MDAGAFSGLPPRETHVFNIGQTGLAASWFFDRLVELLVHGNGLIWRWKND